MQEIVAIVVAGPDIGVRISVGDGVEIGSAPGSGLLLTDPAVSECHLRISRDGEELRVEDLGAAPGARLNGEPIDRVRSLRLGDRLLLGATVIEVVRAESAASMVPLKSPLRVEPSPAAFVPQEFLEGPARDGRSRYGPLASWTDSRVKFQTNVAAFGLLAATAIAVYLFVL
jgi:pSer/pThr/pTyr-binding forkhead associated (FHA) protein